MSKFEVRHPSNEVSHRVSDADVRFVVVARLNRAEEIVRARRFESPAIQAKVAARLAALEAFDHDRVFVAKSWHASRPAAEKAANRMPNASVEPAVKVA